MLLNFIILVNLVKKNKEGAIIAYNTTCVNIYLYCLSNHKCRYKKLKNNQESPCVLLDTITWEKILLWTYQKEKRNQREPKNYLMK